MGIEPTPSAWKAEILPLNYTRLKLTANALVEGGGFEPPKAEPSDLQSDPVDRLGTPPSKTRDCLSTYINCQLIIQEVKMINWNQIRVSIRASLPFTLIKNLRILT